MTLYVDKQAETNGNMKLLQAKLLAFLDREMASGMDWPGIQGCTFEVVGFSPEDGEEDSFIVRFDNGFIIDKA